MNNLYLVRHGHTLWSDTGGIAGRTDIALSDQGTQAVKRLADSVLPHSTFTRWYCSPLQRTQATSLLLRESLQQRSTSPLPTQILDERLVELDFGDWEGLTWPQVHEEHGDLLHAWGEDWINRSPPGGETFQQQIDRCSAWLGECLAHDSPPDGSAMVVTHGGSIRALLCVCLGWPLKRAMQFEVDPASLCWLNRRSADDAWVVRKLNSPYA